MKTNVASIVFFCMAIMPLVIQGNHMQTKKLLDKLAAKGDNIENIFQPSEDGCLGQGISGLTYRGILLKMNITVAMKFIPDEFEMFAKNERQAYATLGAVNRTETETMGIPTLYHYGKWKNYFMIGITLLDSEFQKRKKNNQLTTIDKLIVFQEVVRISKYMHSRDICHGDLFLDNIMFRMNEGFVIDYGLATDTKNDMAKANRCAKRDWRKFLADIASTVRVDIDYTMQTNPISKFQNIEPEGLRRVFCEFANTTYGDAVLEYNALSKAINEEIKRYCGQVPAVFSWITTVNHIDFNVSTENKAQSSTPTTVLLRTKRIA